MAVVSTNKFLGQSRAAWRRWLRVPPGLRLVNFFFQRILRLNAGVPCAVHFTSRVVRPERLTLGEGVERSFAVSGGCYFQAGNGIEIGGGTIFGPGVRVISADHDMANGATWKPTRPIRIGRDCWIGASAIILSGVELGDRVVIGAGAVVTRDVPADSVAVGNPAKVISVRG
jgi:acetyltransferase-like isoleucine patch superfamily enzyme